MMNYQPRRHWERTRYSIRAFGPTMTQLSHYDQTDVNAIVARFKRDGYMPPDLRQPQYGDVSSLNQSLTDLVAQANATEAVAREFLDNFTPPEEEATAESNPQVQQQSSASNQQVEPQK